MTPKEAQLQRRQTEKSVALAAIAEVFQLIEQARGIPDDWERVHLAHAIAAVFSGCYGLALAEAHGARVPSVDRSTAASLPRDEVYGQCDLALLKRAWRAAEAEPVRQFPHLGPIEVGGPSPEPQQGKAWVR